jgi:hypothetical protein
MVTNVFLPSRFPLRGHEGLAMELMACDGVEQANRAVMALGGVGRVNDE